MTCMNCGAVASAPAGWCSACGQPFRPPGPPAAWPTPPAPEAAWPPPHAPEAAWPTPQAPAATDTGWPAPQQPSWSSPNAAWHPSDPSVEQARFTEPSWATDATTTFSVPGAPPAHAHQSPPEMDATVVNSFPAYSPPPPAPYGSPPPPYMVNTQPPYATPQRSGNPFSIVAFVLAGLSLLFPVFIGPLAIVFGAVALFRRERLGKTALALGLAGLIAGVGLGMIASHVLFG